MRSGFPMFVIFLIFCQKLNFKYIIRRKNYIGSNVIFSPYNVIWIFEFLTENPKNDKHGTLRSHPSYLIAAINRHYKIGNFIK